MGKDPEIFLGQLIHGYFGIDLNIVWKTVKKDIPKLKKEINELVESL